MTIDIHKVITGNLITRTPYDMIAYSAIKNKKLLVLVITQMKYYLRNYINPKDSILKEE